MKKTILFFMLLVGSIALISAQATRYIYVAQVKNNKKDTTDKRMELVHLDIDGKSSFFYPEYRAKIDSLVRIMMQTNQWDRKQFENFNSVIPYMVTKDYESQTVKSEQRIGRDNYRYVDERPMDWEIQAETSTLDKYKTQKATVDFAGRKWIAWFTMDIPFSDGPYKFRGLPGLIVKLEDQNGDYVFILQESKKIDGIPDFKRYGNIMDVDRKAYLKQEQAFKKDPAGYLFKGVDTRRKPDPQRMKDIEDRIKKRMEETSNPIELDDK